MIRCERVPRATPDPLTGEPYEWIVHTTEGPVRWSGYTGPLRHDRLDVLCRELIGVDLHELPQVALERLDCNVAATGAAGLILHSTTPGISAFEVDLAAMAEGEVPLDLTTYTETRALFLARPGDLVVGRTRPWRQALEDARDGIEGLILEDADHYYLSHALLHRAHARGVEDPAITRILAHLRGHPEGQVSLYSLEPEWQLLLVWLAHRAGLARLRIDANAPRVANAWNRKSMLHPPVEKVLELAPTGRNPWEILDLESRTSEAFSSLGFVLPVVPGYGVPGGGEHREFVARFVRAGELLDTRYGLTHACLKPSEGGDGGRIVPGLALADVRRLETVAERAWTGDDDWVVEAHVDYVTVELGGEQVATNPSVHVREGRLLEGLTLQFMRGTSWKGNIYVDRAGWDSLGLDVGWYERVREVARMLSDGLRRQGLIRGGIDFAVGRLGGSFRDTPVVAVQDINIKLTGATFLREVMARRRGACPAAATRVFRPTLEARPADVRACLAQVAGAGSVDELIAVVPARWGMLATCGASPRQTAERALELERWLIATGLAVDPRPK